MVERSKEEKEWFNRRISAVRHAYSVYELLRAMGKDWVADKGTPIQVPCNWHGPDTHPSARYYPAEGGNYDHIYCFVCKERWDVVGLFAKFENISFSEGLKSLEKRLGIKTPKKPEAADFKETDIQSADFKSESWKDVPRMMELAEKKLRRARNSCGMQDYIKICRVLDAIDYDLRRGDGKPTKDMEIILNQVLEKIREAQNKFRETQDIVS